MDIAFDEPTGTGGFGFDAASGMGGGMGFGESPVVLGDDLGFGEAAAPAPAPAPAPEPEQSYSPPPPVAAAPAPVSSMFAAPEAENPLTIWEAQHKTHLKEKAEKEKVNNDKMRKDADAWLKSFSDERKKNHDVKHKDNKYNTAACGVHAIPLYFLLFNRILTPISCLACNVSDTQSGLTRKHLRRRWRKSIRQVHLGRASTRWLICNRRLIARMLGA